MIKLKICFFINVVNDMSINKEIFFEELNSINDQEDNIKYSDKNIFGSQHDEAIAVSISSNIDNIDGIAGDVYKTHGGSSCLKKHKLNVGSAIVKKDKRTIFFLITKKLTSDNPSYETLSSCLKQVKEICKENKIKKLAFPKHGSGLDKLCWNSVSQLINKILAKEIECTIYLNKQAPNETNDLDISSKLRKLQKKDLKIREILNEVEKNGPSRGFLIHDGILMKLRKAKNKKIFKQLVVPDKIKKDVLELCHDNYTGSHLGEKKTWVKLNNRFYWHNSYQETIHKSDLVQFVSV